jgi:hypothetical protein
VHNATVIISGLTKFSHPRGAFSPLPFLLSWIRINTERVRSRIEAKNPKNPGPGAWKLPTPSFRLDVMINIEKPKRERLVT